MRLYTLLKQTFTRVLPIHCGGTGSTTNSGIVSNLKTPLIDLIYPIGSIYMSVDSTSPEVLFGGTWKQHKDRFLLSAGDTYEAGSTGGEATHTLVTNELPSHTHTFTGTSASTNNTGAHTHNVRGWYTETSSKYGLQSAANFSSWRDLAGVALSNGNHTHTVTAAGTNSNTGGDGAHNNMPPYLTVYIWERV